MVGIFRHDPGEAAGKRMFTYPTLWPIKRKEELIFAW
jgi:hypothetical protein